MRSAGLYFAESSRVLCGKYSSTLRKVRCRLPPVAARRRARPRAPGLSPGHARRPRGILPRAPRWCQELFMRVLFPGCFPAQAGEASRNKKTETQDGGLSGACARNSPPSSIPISQRQGVEVLPCFPGLIELLARRPAVHPAEHRRAVCLELQRQPHVARVLQAAWVPAVGHEYVAVVCSFHLKYIGALRVE